jgi:hypothetical protein
LSGLARNTQHLAPELRRREEVVGVAVNTQSGQPALVHVELQQSGRESCRQGALHKSGTPSMTCAEAPWVMDLRFTQIKRPEGGSFASHRACMRLGFGGLPV